MGLLTKELRGLLVYINISGLHGLILWCNRAFMRICLSCRFVVRFIHVTRVKETSEVLKRTLCIVRFDQKLPKII